VPSRYASHHQAAARTIATSTISISMTGSFGGSLHFPLPGMAYCRFVSHSVVWERLNGPKGRRRVGHDRRAKDR
jgi:hypothetical protein